MDEYFEPVLNNMDVSDKADAFMSVNSWCGLSRLKWSCCHYTENSQPSGSFLLTSVLVYTWISSVLITFLNNLQTSFGIYVVCKQNTDPIGLQHIHVSIGVVIHLLVNVADGLETEDGIFILAQGLVDAAQLWRGDRHR